jgi:hypothetical protein
MEPIKGKRGTLEIFCVDISRSMWYDTLNSNYHTQANRLAHKFPYLLGQSKISIARRIIEKPLPDLNSNVHYSCLVLFDRYYSRFIEPS